MKTFFKTALFFVTAAVLTACSTAPKLAPAGLYDAGSYSVNLTKDWNAISVRTGKNKKAHLLTLDGPMLNSVYLFSDLAEGDSLIKEVRRENPVPKYDAAMFDLELVEFISDSLQRGGGLGGMVTQNVRPEQWGGLDAIRFEFTGRTSTGLNMSGDVLFAVENDTLDIILFLAPSEYYAGKDRASVDAIFASAIAGAASPAGGA